MQVIEKLEQKRNALIAEYNVATEAEKYWIGLELDAVEAKLSQAKKRP
jgi:hypothetical protein